MNWIYEPWPWYVSGPIIGVVMLLLIFGGKNFGMSANLRTMCSIGGGGKVADFFQFDWKKQTWNLMVVIGAIIGGYIASQYLSNGTEIDLNPTTVEALQNMGFSAPTQYVPDELFGIESILSIKGILILIVAGLFIGFGSRYAGGCTSGHAISGLSDLQIPSLIAVVGFFIGGIIMTFLIFPILF